MVDKWLGIGDDDKYDLYRNKTTHGGSQEKGMGQFPPFSEFCNFLRKESRIVCNPITSQVALKEGLKKISDLKKPHFDSEKKRDHGAGSFATGSHEVKERENVTHKNRPIKQSCIMCKQNHGIDECQKFLEMPLSDRSLVKEKGFCWGCFRWRHMIKTCQRKKICEFSTGFHPSSLNDDTR